MFCYQRELQKAWILWNGKERTKSTLCICLLSVTSQNFLNTWGVTWWGGVGGYHFKWRQFSDFFLMLSNKSYREHPKVSVRSSEVLVHSESAGPKGALSAQPHPPRWTPLRDLLWHSLSASGIFAVWADTHTSTSLGCTGAGLQAALICRVWEWDTPPGVKQSQWSTSCVLYLFI